MCFEYERCLNLCMNSFLQDIKNVETDDHLDTLQQTEFITNEALNFFDLTFPFGDFFFLLRPKKKQCDRVLERYPSHC